MKKTLILAIFAILMLSSCDNFKEGQEIPAYIKFKGFYLEENPNFTFSQSEDLLTSDIRDVWVYVDGKILGAFPFHLDEDSSYYCSFPILKEGEHRISLRPGIIYNGMNNMREEYVFYTSYNDTLDLVPGQEIVIEPQPIMYSDKFSMPLKETFENYFVNFQQADVVGTEPLPMAIINNDSVRYGNHCGAIYFENGGHNKYITIDSIFCNNTDGGIVLEIDYYSNIPFEVGLYGRSQSEEALKYISAVRLTPPQSGKWQKAYVLLSKVWNTLGYPTTFKVYLEAFNPNNVQNSFIHIDNIKFVQYPNK